MSYYDDDEEENDEGVSLGQASCIHVKGQAIKVRLANGKEDWIPQSQVHDDCEVYELGHEGDLIVTTWWAGEHGYA